MLTNTSEPVRVLTRLASTLPAVLGLLTGVGLHLPAGWTALIVAAPSVLVFIATGEKLRGLVSPANGATVATDDVPMGEPVDADG